jgi:hypothetical protein
VTKVTVHKGSATQSPETANSEGGTGNAPQIGPAKLPAYLQSCHRVADARGRIFYLKKLRPSDRLQVALTLGENSENSAVLTQATLLQSIKGVYDRTEIAEGSDGFSHSFLFSSVTELMTAADYVDEDGMAAVLKGWREAGWLAGGDEAPKQAADAAKNS